MLATAQREGFVELLEERVEKARICPFVPPPWGIEYGRIAELMGAWRGLGLRSYLLGSSGCPIRSRQGGS